MGRRLLFGAAALLFLLVGTGCQVTLTAAVEAERDGGGWVRAGIGLDAEALRELGDPVKELRLDDLRQSGWDVKGPQQDKDDDKDGLTWVRASKRFANPTEAAQVTAELSGPDGPFRDFRLQRSRTFLKTKTSFSGLVDLSRGLAGLNDPALQEKLGDYDLGLDPARLGNDKVKVEVEAKLPGETRRWHPALGEQVQLQAASEVWNLVPVLPAVAAVVLAVAAVAVVARRR